jgi:hypothetical protein
MDAITLSVEIHEDRRLVIDLPPDIPLGTAQITIQLSEPITAQSTSIINTAREIARTKLLESGFLSTTWQAPEGTIRLSDQELQQLGQKRKGGKTLDQLIDEDRESD